MPELSDDAFAEAIGLRRVDCDGPGIVRQRCGRGFTYRDERGEVVRGPDRERCEALVLPPAWEEVWICRHADGHVQATGIDEAGRRQYRYHDRWTEARSAAKFDHLEQVGRCLSGLRRRLDEDLASDDPVRRSLAAMVKLLDSSLERIGNPSSVEEHGTRGISTLAPHNVDVSANRVRMSFRGKGQVDHDVTVDDRSVAAVLDELERRNDEWLFEIGDRVLDAADANEYLDEHTAGRLDCKDLRTWGGSAAALDARARGVDDVPAVIDAAADVLHNTRAVARSAYVHPTVLDASDEAVEEAWKRSRRSKWYGRGERALLNLLADQPKLLDHHVLESFRSHR